jgi:hypothetical protein
MISGLTQFLAEFFQKTLAYLSSWAHELFISLLGAQWLLDLLPMEVIEWFADGNHLGFIDELSIAADALAWINWMLPLEPIIGLYLLGLTSVGAVRLIRWVLALIPTLGL